MTSLRGGKQRQYIGVHPATLLDMHAATAELPSTETEWDRRSYTRVPFQTPVFIDGNWQSQVCWCRDVSLGGMAVEAPKSIQLGELIELWFELPDGLDVECDAKVVHRRGSKLGLRFISMQGQSVCNLKDYVTGDQASGVFFLPRH